MQMEKKKRKQRTVKHAMVDIDSIAVQPGHQYCNWIKVAKLQLKERETAFMGIKKTEIELNVNKELANALNSIHCNISKYTLSQQIISNTLSVLYDQIDQWKGVCLIKTKAQVYTRYRDYFSIAKNWFYAVKKKIFGSLFWAAVFCNIRQFLCTCMRRNNNNNNNNDYRLWIELNIIASLFDATVKYSNTKPLRLIAGQSIVFSKEMQKYLLDLHHTLNITEWIQQHRSNNVAMQKTKYICSRMQLELNTLIKSQTQFCLKTEIKAESVSNNNRCNEIGNISNVPVLGRINQPIIDNKVRNANHNHMNTNNSNNIARQPHNIQPPNIVMHNNINNNNNVNHQIRIPYAGFHNAPLYTTSDNRYSPYGNVFILAHPVVINLHLQ